MPQSAYPEVTDLEDFLGEAGVTITSPTVLSAALLAGIQGFENDTSRHFLAGFDIENEVIPEETRYFDPPHGHERILFLGPWNDIFEVTSVASQMLPAGDTTTLVLNEDYTLEPVNNPARHRPYTQIRRGRFGNWYPWFTGGWGWHSSANSIQVTGLWGYSDAIPDDAWLAMLTYGALWVEDKYRLKSTGGRTGYTAGRVTEQFGVESYTNIVTGWRNMVAQAVATYRLTEI